MCFSWGWIEQLFIWLVVVIAVVAIIRLLVPLVLAQLGAGGATVMAVLNIVLWAVVTIFVIYLCFDLISCLLSAGHGLRMR